MTTNIAVPVRRGALSIAAAAVAWGTGGAIAVYLSRAHGLGPITVSFWRFAVAVAALATSRLVRGRLLRGRTSGGRTAREGRPNDPAEATLRWTAAILTGAGLALSQTAYFAAVDGAGVALGTLVTIGAAPVLIAFGARYALGERMTRHRIALTVVALGGLGLLVLGSPSAGGHPVRGIALALLSAGAYSAVTLQSRAGLGSGANLPAFAAGMVCLAPFAAVAGALPRDGSAIGALVFLGVVPTALAYSWFFAGLRTVPAASAAVIVLLEPVTAAALAVGLLGERLTTTMAAGATVLLAAVIAITVDTRPPRAAALHPVGSQVWFDTPPGNQDV